MESLRKTLFWLHLCAALTAGLVILLLAATGLLLAFEAQIQGWADRGDRRVEEPAAGAPRPLETLLADLAAQRPELAVASLTLRNEPGAAVALGLGREGVLYVDPARGTVLGPGSTAVRRFFRGVTDLHRYLGASGAAREAGKRATGVATLLFTVILLSGLYIWLPRGLAKGRFRNALWFRRGLSPKARDFNWHHVFGIWALVPLLAIVISALPISFEWAGRAVLVVTGSPVESRPAAAAAPRSPAARPETPKLGAMALTGLDAAVARATAETPAWRSLSLRLPARDDGAWTITTDLSPRRGRPDRRTRLVLDAAGSSVVERELFADQSLGRRTRSWMRWIHTGEAAGLPGQAVAALACAAVLFLGWTGYRLAWRRFRAFRERRRLARSPRAALRPDTAFLPEPPAPLED